LRGQETIATSYQFEKEIEAARASNKLQLQEFVLQEETQENRMTANSSNLGLAIAIALTTGSVLADHPPLTKEAPSAYSDITLAEADSQKIPPSNPANQEKAPSAAANPAPVTEVPAPITEAAPPNTQSTPGEESKGIPPRHPQP
jgi:hypothetical protein